MDRQVELASSIDDKGTTLYAHLKHIYDAFGEMDPLLEPVEIPKSAEWILEQFWQLNRKRDFDGMGGHPKPISYQEIWCFMQLKRIRFSDFDLQAIDAMDFAYMKASRKQKEVKTDE